MSFDSPIQIDLSQEEDLAKLATDLTLEEQVRLDEYFGEKKKGIIYLTGQELSELKFIISEESSASHQADFDTFIQEQKIEWLSSSDIFTSIDGAPKDLGEKIDALSQKALFWAEWILKNLILSDIAKDNIITSFSISMLWNIDIGANFKWDIMAAFENAITNLEWLKNLASSSEIVGTGIQKNVLNLSGNGNRNYIFMDANVGREFFNTLLSQSMTESEIESYIEKRNLPPESDTIIVNNIAWLTVSSSKSIQRLTQALTLPSQSIDSSFPATQAEVEVIADTIDPEDIPNQEELDELKEKKGIWSLLAELIEMILGTFQRLTTAAGEDINDFIDGEGKWAKDDEPETKSSEDILKNLMWQYNIPGEKEILKNEEMQTQIKNSLISIYGEESISDGFTELFSWEKYNNIATEFIENGIFWDKPDDINPWMKVVKIITAYAEYRNDPRVKNVTEERLEWSAWAQEQNWPDTQN